MSDDELIERGAGSDQESEGSLAAPAGTPGLLPHRGQRPRIPSQHDRAQLADIDAQLERVGGHDGADGPLTQAALDRSPLQRQVASPVAVHTVGVASGLGHGVLQIPQHNLRRPARAGEDGGLDVVTDQARRGVGGLEGVGAANAEAGIHHGGVVEHDVFLSARRPIEIGRDQPYRRLDEPLGQFLGIGDGRRGQNEVRLGTVEATHPAQSAEQIGHVGAEDAAVHMQLIEHDPAQVFQEPGPARVVGQDPGVEHVGIADQQTRLIARRAPLGGGRVAVVETHGDGAPDDLQESRQLGGLILRQGLGREQIEGARFGVGQQM